MTINLTTLRNNVFLDVYGVINTNVSDPLSRGKQWIFSSPNVIFAPNFIGFPIIVIKKAKIGKAYDNFSNDKPTYQAVITIYIMTTSNQLLDTLSNQVDNVMEINYFPQFTFNNYDEDEGEFEHNSQKVYYRKMLYGVEISNLY